jgi:hypothetical protein
MKFVILKIIYNFIKMLNCLKCNNIIDLKNFLYCKKCYISFCINGRLLCFMCNKIYTNKCKSKKCIRYVYYCEKCGDGFNNKYCDICI